MTPVPLHTRATVTGVAGIRLMKVLSAEEAASGAYPPSQVLIADQEAGSLAGAADAVSVAALSDPRVVAPGDVVRLREDSGLVSVLFRRGSKANTLFATERCNSLCLMCSQPPRDDNDDWRIAELLELIPLIDRDEVQLGITGGEPTLLGTGLAEVIRAGRTWLPDTHLHVLTNGRRFADRPMAETWLDAGGDATTWAVPLYADVAAIHDTVVDAPGAFDETIRGLHEMARAGAQVEIRVVLHRLTIPRLPQLAAFIYRRLPFVAHVALMGLEPMGFAKRNRDRLWIDPADYADELAAATHYLANRGMQVSVYNLPLCTLPRSLWPFAQRSISDWKNAFAPECTGCVVKDFCAGFFASAGPAWRSRSVNPITLEDLAA